MARVGLVYDPLYLEHDTGGHPENAKRLRAIIALPGVVIPVTGAVFAPATIRGSESQAMLCSERELLLSEEHDGIIDVQGDWAVGTPAATALGLDDPMFYVKVTANRPRTIRSASRWGIC